MATTTHINNPISLSSPAAVDNSSNDHPLILNADEPLVISTPFLQWQSFPPAAPGGPPRMGIPHHRAIKAFARRCSLSTAAADLTGMAAIDCFVLFLSAAAWQRLLNELLASKLLEGGPFTAWSTFLDRIERIEVTTPSSLALTMNDFDLGESFEAPAIPGRAAIPGAAGRRGQPRAPAIPAVAAQPAQPGPPDIAYLSLVTINTMFYPSTNSPLGSWCDLVGALGVGRTRSSRRPPLANVRTADVMLSSAVASRVLGSGANQAPNALIAVHLPDMFREMQLPNLSFGRVEHR
mmetsp:Transcript_23682/g.57119  ORF Transcript_23682/g.57119 Transcript_23682/m.57119 type:complete len:293 (+) Transcript_23682:73-951(+)